MGDVAAALRRAAQGLAGVSESPRLDAELLMAHALGVPRSDMLLRRMDGAEPSAFAALLERRLAHEPVAYILGHQEFYGLDFAVTPAVLIPRGDSETLIDAAIAAFAAHPPQQIIDLGTGSGALLLAALSQWPGATGVGIDRSAAALEIASANAAALAIARADFAERNWHDPRWREGLGRFDLVLANPPYVETGAVLAPQVRGHEPAGALFAGIDGLDDYRVLIPQLPDLLTESGIALVEIGHTQADAVTALAEAAGFAATLHRDLAGLPRALELCRTRNISLGNPPRDH